MTAQNVQPGETPDQRAQFIAGLHEYADWLEANPWMPVTQPTGHQSPVRLQIDLDGYEGLRQVRDLGAWLGTDADEHLADRTSVHVVVGSASHSVIAWHRDGRPNEKDAEIERLRAELAQMRAEAAKSVWCGGDCTLVADHAGDHEIRGDVGLAYTRADTEDEDPRPVSPARVPLHTGSVVNGNQLVVDAL